MLPSIEQRDRAVAEVRLRLAGNVCALPCSIARTSAIPLPMTLAAIPVAREAAAIPPYPKVIASFVTKRRRALSRRLLFSLTKRSRIFDSLALRSFIILR